MMQEGSDTMELYRRDDVMDAYVFVDKVNALTLKQTMNAQAFHEARAMLIRYFSEIKDSLAYEILFSGLEISIRDEPLSFSIDIEFYGVVFQAYGRIETDNLSTPPEINIRINYRYVNRAKKEKGEDRSVSYHRLGEVQLPAPIEEQLLVESGICRIQSTEEPFSAAFLSNIIDKMYLCFEFAYSEYQTRYDEIKAGTQLPIQSTINWHDVPKKRCLAALVMVIYPSLNNI
jgi:hypothetical protein